LKDQKEEGSFPQEQIRVTGTALCQVKKRKVIRKEFVYNSKTTGKKKKPSKRNQEEMGSQSRGRKSVGDFFGFGWEVTRPRGAPGD